jgi:hypothetical protein
MPSVELRLAAPSLPTAVATPIILTPAARQVELLFPTPAVVAGLPGGGFNASGIPHPPPRSGYARIDQTDFPNTVPIGPAHPETLNHLKPRPDVARDATFTDSSGRGHYSWKHTTSEHDGMLDIWLHTENAGQGTRSHVPSGTVHYVSAPLSVVADTVAHKKAFDVHLIAKYPVVDGRKIAHLLWNTGTNVNGEDDFPEGKLDGGTDKGNGFHHFFGTGGQQAWPAHTNLQNWHLYTIRYHAKGYRGHATGYIQFLLDGVKISSGSGETDRICPDGMWYVAQIETFLAGQPIPDPADEGHVYFDWFAIDELI